MKKLAIILLFCALSLILAACSDSDDKSKSDDSKISIYTTVYPLLYFAERIGGDYVNVQSIYPPGANEHTFEPTQKTMIDVAKSDLFFYIGLGLEGFVEKAEKSLEKENVKFVATADNVSEQLLDVSTGHTHDENEEEEEEHHHGEHDSHVWLSPIISKDLAAVIKDELVAAMPEQEQLFTENYNTLVQDLQTLDQEFQQMGASVPNKTFFVSHAAFGYIAGHYGLKQVPVAGLNSQSEPSQKELASIVDLAKKENIKYIFFEQNVSSKLTKVIQEEIGAEALTLHNLSVLTKEDIKNNEDYFTLMRANINALEKALK